MISWNAQNQTDICNEDDTGPSKPAADNNSITCPKRIVFSLYYYVFLLVFFYSSVSFYVPLLASMAIVNINSVNFSIIGSLIPKLTPVNGASFYQSITFDTAYQYDPHSCNSWWHIFQNADVLQLFWSYIIAWLIGVIWFLNIYGY